MCRFDANGFRNSKQDASTNLRKQVSDSATGLTEIYTWNNDGTLASSPGPAGSGYSLLFGYDEEQHLTSLQHNTGGTITTAYQYGYGADGGRRWRKDIANNVWTWYPCGVACNAGELVEQTSDLTGTTWTTSALYLKSGSGCGAQIIRRNGEYHHFDVRGMLSTVTSASGNVLATPIYDRFGVQAYSNGTVQTPWKQMGTASDEDNLSITGSEFVLLNRNLPLQSNTIHPDHLPIVALCAVACAGLLILVIAAWRECERKKDCAGRATNADYYICMMKCAAQDGCNNVLGWIFCGGCILCICGVLKINFKVCLALTP